MIPEIIFSILGTLLVVGVIIYVIKVGSATTKIDVMPNLPICDNPYRTQFTNGYSLGLEKTALLRKNGCRLIEFYPLDTEQGENVPKSQIQSMVVGRGMRKVFGRGEPSSYRERIIYITKNALDIPEKMRDLKETKKNQKEALKQHFTNLWGTSVDAGFEALAEEMPEHAYGQITKNTLQQIKESNREFRRMKLVEGEEKEEKK